MNVKIAFLFFVTFLNLLIAAFILLKNYKATANLSFSITIFGLSLWAFTNGIIKIVPDISTAYFWALMSYLAGVIIASNFLVFALAFPKAQKTFSKRIESAIYLSAFLMAVWIFVPGLVLKNVVFQGGRFSGLVTGWGVVLYGVYVAILLLLAISILVRNYKISLGTTKEQIKFILTGTTLTALLGLTTNLMLPIVFSSYQLVWLGPNFTIIMIVATAYAIVKHRLMDIRLAIRAGILKLLMIFILAGSFYFLAQGYLITLVQPTHKRILFVATLASAALVFIYTPLDRLVRSLTDKVLFQREYSARELIRQLGKKMAESLDLDELLGEIKKTLKGVMRVNYVGFVLVGSKTNLEVRGFSDRHDYPWSQDDILLEQLRSDPRLLVNDELKREISEGRESPTRLRQKKVIHQMEELSAAVLVPLITKEDVTGLIVLGEKKTGDAFTSSDLDTLETLKYQMGVAIENAILFNEIQAFNRKLSVEINRATKSLQIKNRNLLVLRKLDTIIINTLKLSEMSQKIVDTISWEAGFLGGLIALLETQGSEQSLRAQAISATPNFTRLLTKLPKKLTDYRLSLSLDPSNLLTKALRERAPQASNKFTDFYSPPLPYALAKIIENMVKVKHHVAYPLSAKGKVLGVIVFGLPIPYEELSQSDLELLQAFMDQAGIAIENAKLYEDLRRINQELKQANEQLLDLDRMKDELVSVASHELRTPMTAIKSYLWMMLNKYQDEIRNPKLQKYLSRAYESSERMINLVNDMLSVSKIDTGRLELEIKPTDLKSLIKSVIADFETTATEEKVELFFEEPKRIIPKVSIDEDKIREVLMNLIGNSLKYTQAGGKVWVDLAREKEMLKVGIHDNGLGIAKQDLPRLFKKFGRINSSFVTAAETGGTGLGLYISKGIVDLHGGKIWVKSEKNKGSHFYFTVKVAH